MNIHLEDEARCETRLMFYPVFPSACVASASQAIVVASVEAFAQTWVTLTQETARGKRRGIFMLEDVQVLTRDNVEWELLKRLGVERVAANLERWPSTPRSASSVRGQFVVPRDVALEQGLSVEWR